jgi:tetratricopeptide (TPR) repeat protein
MRALAKLKDEARRHEQEESWSKAIAVYLQILESGDAGEVEVELSLYNRVGDLYVRLGEPIKAVAYYVDAADRYADAGLFNNAIALCNKALRYMPDRVELLRKLGRFSASQGFLTDARRWYLEYAERMFRDGNLDEAFVALEDFADLAEDATVRELLGRRLQAHGRTEQAVAELKRAYALRIAAGEQEAADALRDEIYAIDRDAGPLDVAVASPRRASAAGVALPGLAELGDDIEAEPDRATAVDAEAGAVDAVGAPEAADELGLERTAFEQPEAIETAELEGLEHSDLGGLSPEPDAGDSADPALPLLSGDAPSDDERVAVADPDEAAGLATLPLLEVDGEPVESPGVDVSEDITEEPAFEAAREAAAHGRRREAAELFRTLAAELTAAGRPAAAARALEELLALDPDNVAALQARVEALAFAGGGARLIEAYLELARTLERSGATKRAEAVYRQVLELDPGNDAARRVVDVHDARRAQTGFVDLGALILDEEGPERTRFYVAEKEPSGDEDHDFSELLSQFKEKIAENLGAEDAGSHYDLGLAYKDMGLLDEAISEFQVALRAGDDRLKIYEELGNCFLANGQHGVAVKVLGRAVEGRRDDELELVGVFYLLGRAHEALAQPDSARDAYERVIALDVGFRDAADRLGRL